YDAHWNVLENLTYEFNQGVRDISEHNIYTYDTNNNQTSYSYEYWYDGEWERIQWGNATYDASGNLLYSYSSCQGCGEADSHFTYDNRGRLIHTSSYSITHGGLESSSTCDVYFHLISGPHSVCENSSIVLTADSGYVSYNWS